MVGRLKYLGSERFCVEYEEEDIYVIWRPGTSQAAEKPTKWANEAWPKLEQVPENLLRDLIGSQASFAGGVEVEETAVTMRGSLDDGGSITIGYVKGFRRRVYQKGSNRRPPTS